MKRAIKPSIINPLKERFAIAPMVDVTDNYFRYFCRFITKHSFLYTEMLNEHSIIYMDKQKRDRFLGFYGQQNPIVA